MKKLILICDVLFIVVLLYSIAFGSPFCSPDTYSTTYYEVWSMCGADFNGDTYMDIALYNTTYAPAGTLGAVTIHLNDDPLGTFSQDESTYHVPPSRYTNSIEAGDLDGDDAIDLAVACDSFIVIFWGVGNGRFDSTHYHQLEIGFKRLHLSDLNDDGWLDIAVSNKETGRITVWINDTLSRGFADSTTYEVGGDPAKVIAPDLDTDGDLDLVVGNWASTDSLPILWNNGEGEFDSVTYLDLPDGLIGGNPTELTALDVDGLNGPDLTIANSAATGGHVAVMTNDGDGTFTLNDYYEVPKEITSIIAKTLRDPGNENDEEEDLIIGNYDNDYFHILWSQDDSSFEIEKVLDYNPVGCYCFFAGDLNGDGENDLAGGTPVDDPPDVDLLIYLSCKGVGIRGDVNCDDEVTMADVVYLQNYLFHQGDPPCEEDVGDVNCSGETDASDLVYLFNYVMGTFRPPCCKPCDG